MVMMASLRGGMASAPKAFPMSSVRVRRGLISSAFVRGGAPHPLEDCDGEHPPVGQDLRVARAAEEGARRWRLATPKSRGGGVLWARDLAMNEVVMQEVYEPETSKTQKVQKEPAPEEQTTNDKVRTADVLSRQRLRGSSHVDHVPRGAVRSPLFDPRRRQLSTQSDRVLRYG